MSYMQAAQKVSEGHYILPKMGSMNCQVDAFLSEELFLASDEKTWQQAVHSASMPGAIGMYLMPDTHMGFGIPIGGVLVTEDTIVPVGSGYDISCGVIYLKVPGLTAKSVRSWHRREQWVQEVENRVGMGIGKGRSDQARKVNPRVIEDVLRYGAKALGVKADLCERQFIDVPDDLDFAKIEKAWNKAKPQLGSLGGGNHFIEMQVDRDDGSVWVMIHTGSRGYGYQTAQHFFREGKAYRGLRRQEDVWLRLDEEMGRDYWAHHNSAANYAIANRWTIVDGIRDATLEVFGCDVDPFYEISHNLVQQETIVLPDGSTRKGFVHRKGATRAFPAGHPDLVGTPWYETGHPCLIPGSMLTGAAILYPEQGAYKSGCSVNHGSGRMLGRGDARRRLASLQEEIDDEMRTIKRTFGPKKVQIEGIVTNHKHTPLDECGHAYKDLDEVLRVLEVENIARVAHRMFPVANLKGSD